MPNPYHRYRFATQVIHETGQPLMRAEDVALRLVTPDEVAKWPQAGRQLLPGQQLMIDRDGSLYLADEQDRESAQDPEPDA